MALSSLTYGYAFSVFNISISQPGFYKYFQFKLHRPSSILHGFHPRSSEFSLLGWSCVCSAVHRMAARHDRKKVHYNSRSYDKFDRTSKITFKGKNANELTGIPGFGDGKRGYPMLIVVRLLHGVGVGQCITITPIYLSEVAPPHRRGC